MAGRGSRFSDIDPTKPKPLVLLHGKPLIEWVICNLKITGEQKYIFVCQEAHVSEFQLHKYFDSLGINYQIITTPVITKGAACSALLAKDAVQGGEIVIANSDQFMVFEMDDFLRDCRFRNLDGSIVSMIASGTKWSYIKTDSKSFVTEIKEKVAISDIATTGLYFFRNWDIFENACQKMISKDDTFNDEFYLAPVYNYMLNTLSVSHYPIGTAGEEMIGLGTKEDFLRFQSELRSKELRERLFT